YDTLGAESYHSLFARDLVRFTKTWGIEASVSELLIDSDDIAHWTVATKGANWETSTRYEFVRLEHVVRAAVRRPIVGEIPRTLYWIFDDLVSGAFWRTMRAAWRFALHLTVLQAPLLAWLALTIAAGCGAGIAIARVTGSAAIGLLSAGGVWAAMFALLRPLSDRSVLLRVANGWPVMRDFARGRP